MTDTTTTTTDRIRWDQLEINKLASEWIIARLKHPFTSTMELFDRVQIAALPEHRRRQIASLKACPDIMNRIMKEWQETLDAVEPNRAPTVVHVETQRPPDYVDMLNNLDMPSLVALIVAKLGKELDALKPLLHLVSGNGNGNGQQIGAPLKPAVSLLAAASAKPRKTRVLVLGPLASQFQEIKSQAEEAELPVDLQFLDKDKPKSSVPISTDFVVATRFISHSIEEVIKKHVPAGRYFYMGAESGVGAVVQKLRDIGSMLPYRS